MDNAVKKYIDRLKKTKQSINSNNSYEQYLLELTSIDLGKSFFCNSDDIVALLDLLVLEIAYKKSLKFACDLDHPMVHELFADIGLDDVSISRCIENVKQINTERLDYYLLFQDEFDLKQIRLIIDSLAEYSSHGSIISHASKMTHPACKYPKLFYQGDFNTDGLVRSGNASVGFDLHINANKLKLFKFLSLKYNGKTLLHYIKNNDSEVFQNLFEVSLEKANEWIWAFSNCINNQDYRTDRFIKQIYFPVKGDYHLLSTLHPSSLMSLLKDKIDFLNLHSPATYSGRKKKKDNKKSDVQFSTVPNLTMIKYGGEHPKNISGLSNKYQTYYLLSSVPPSIEAHSIRFPKHDFFQESLKPWEMKEIFHALHAIYVTDYNNQKIREGKYYRYQQLIDRVVEKMWAVRSVADVQYYENNSWLKRYQKVWLLEEFSQNRESEETWLDELTEEIARWIQRGYEKSVGKAFITQGKAEYQDILDVVNQNREVFR